MSKQTPNPQKGLSAGAADPVCTAPDKKPVEIKKAEAPAVPVSAPKPEDSSRDISSFSKPDEQKKAVAVAPAPSRAVPVAPQSAEPKKAPIPTSAQTDISSYYSEDSRNDGKKKTLIISAVACLVVALIAVGVLLGSSLLKSPGQDPASSSSDAGFTFGKGISVSGVKLDGRTEEEARTALTEKEAALAGEYKVDVSYKKASFSITSADLALTFNTDAVLEEAKKRSEPEASGSSISSEPLELVASFSMDGVTKKISAFAKEIDKKAVEPTVVDFDFDTLEFSYKDGEKGRKVDQKKLSEEIETILKEKKSGTVTATVKEVDFKTSQSDLSKKMGLIGTYSNVCTNNSNSEHNMRLAMQKMNQHVIPAGEIISFHGMVGDSTVPDGGWVQSGGWMNGELVPMYGGGICQAATVLYNCGLYSNLEVVERACHMQPSSYCEPGLDATVDYPYLDVQMRNTTEYPIYIVSCYGWHDPYHVHVRIYFR